VLDLTEFPHDLCSWHGCDGCDADHTTCVSFGGINSAVHKCETALQGDNSPNLMSGVERDRAGVNTQYLRFSIMLVR